MLNPQQPRSLTWRKFPTSKVDRTTEAKRKEAPINYMKPVRVPIPRNVHMAPTMDRVSTPVLLALVLFLATAMPIAAQQWAQTFGGPGADLGYDVTPSADGGAIAVGLTNTDLLIDGFVVKTDSEGALIWQRSLSLSPLAETFYSVLPTPSGGAIIAGSAEEPGNPNYRPWLLELDTNGETVWSSEDDFTSDLPVDSAIVRAVRLNDGRLALTGGANTFTNPEDPWVLIVDSDGTQVSFEQFQTLATPGFGVATYINGLEATADGGFIATGTVSGGLGFAFLWKFDAQGQPEWDRLYQQDAFREGYAVRQLSDGGYLATGCALPNCNNTAVLRTDATGLTSWFQVLDDPNDRRSFGRDILELPNNDLQLLQNLDSVVGSSVFSTELVTLSPNGQVDEIVGLEVGSNSTAGYSLSRSSVGDLWVAGYSNDTTDPVQIDLFVSLAERGTGPAAMVFSDGFELGHTAAWTATFQ